MPVNFGGKWTLSEFHNYEEFVDDMNVPPPMKAFLMMKADLEIEHEGDIVKYKRKKAMTFWN